MIGLSLVVSLGGFDALAANSPMPGPPAGNQPYPGLAQSRPGIRTRVLGGSAVGSGTRVALTDAGSIVRSSDGVEWFNVPRANVPLYGIACGGGLVVAVGHCGTILASTDGVDWKPQVSGTPSALHSVAYGAGTFVTVGNEGVVLSSTDGISWVNRNSPASAAGDALKPSGIEERLRGVTFGNDRFVAVGYNGMLLSSKDGARWSRLNSHTHERLQGIEFGNGLFVAVGWHGTVLLSHDGISWARTSAGSANLSSIVWQNQLFAVTGANGTVSADGKGWLLPQTSTTPILAASDSTSVWP